MSLQTNLYIKNTSGGDLVAPGNIQWSLNDTSSALALNDDGTLINNKIVDLYLINDRVTIANSEELKNEVTNATIKVLADDGITELSPTEGLLKIGLATVDEVKELVLEGSDITIATQADADAQSTESLKGREILVTGDVTFSYTLLDAIVVLDDGVDVTMSKVNNCEVFGSNSGTILTCLDILASTVNVDKINALQIVGSNVTFDEIIFEGDTVRIIGSNLTGVKATLYNQTLTPIVQSNNINVDEISTTYDINYSKPIGLQYDFGDSRIVANKFTQNLQWMGSSTSNHIDIKFSGIVNINQYLINGYVITRLIDSAMLKVSDSYNLQHLLYTSYSTTFEATRGQKLFVYNSSNNLVGNISSLTYGIKINGTKINTNTGLNTYIGTFIDDDEMNAATGYTPGSYATQKSTGTFFSYDGTDWVDTGIVSKMIPSLNETLLLNTNAAVYADAKAGAVDPSGTSGWYFTNEVIGEKVNWYYMANTNPEVDLKLGTVKNQYALTEIKKEREPFFVLYTVPQGDGNDAASWYRSRVLYFTDGSWDGLANTTKLCYWGQEPNAFPNVDRVEFTYDPIFSSGPQDPDEDILVGAFGTDSSAAVGTYEFVIKNLGFTNIVNRTDFLLHAQPESLPFVYTAQGYSSTYANTHYITLDATNDFIDLDTGVNADVLDYTKEWSIGMEIESVSSVNDSSYSAVFSRGKNQITLRKGGSNWGVYFFADGRSVAQANTWVAPQAGDKVLFVCTGTHLKYYLNGSLRSNTAINANVSYNDPVGNLQVGKPATSNAGYWFGGVNNLMIMVGADAVLGTESVNTYFAGEDVTQMDFYESVLDFLPLGEAAYPDVIGLKAVVSGELKNGTTSDFVQR